MYITTSYVVSGDVPTTCVVIWFFCLPFYFLGFTLEQEAGERDDLPQIPRLPLAKRLISQ